MANESYADLVRCFPDVDRVIPFPRRGFAAKCPGFLKELRREQYDVIVDLQGLLKSALVTRLARGCRRVGPSFCREGSHLTYGELAGPRHPERHAVEQNLDVVTHLNLPILPVEFPVRFPESRTEGKRPWIALLPVSRWPSKNWPAKHFVELGRVLRRETEGTVFLLGDKGEAAVCDSIARGIGEEAENLAGKLNLVELGAFLSKTDVLVANDSGPVHMAAAVGTPTVVLFGPTNPSRTGPYGDNHRILIAPYPCRPCYRRSCKKGGKVCLESIAPEEVARAALDSLARCADRPR